MEGCQTPRIDWECDHCHAHRYDCIDCGKPCISGSSDDELCDLCFLGRAQETELEELKRGDRVLMPVSIEHAEAMHLVASKYLDTHKR